MGTFLFLIIYGSSKWAKNNSIIIHTIFSGMKNEASLNCGIYALLPHNNKSISKLI